jgi:zinc transport system substrate-binding protein
LVDGEAVILGVDGVPDFNVLHSRKHEDEVQPYGSEIAIFFDGESRARISSERTMHASKPVLRESAPGVPHHRVAVANNRYTLISEPNAQNSDELPIGIKIVDRSGAQIGGVHSCPDLHGEATSGNVLAFSCASGLLVVSMDVSTPQIKHLPYAAALPSGKTTTMLGGRGLQYFLGKMA